MSGQGPASEGGRAAPAGAPATESAPATPPRRPWMASPYFWAALAGLVLIPALRPLLRRVPDPPPVLGQLPDFSLIDQRGEEYGLADLAGEVWVANFFFTSCVTVCPPLMRAAAGLQERFAAARVPVRQVSITVDPFTDTPDRLTRFGRAYGVDPKHWRLLTGDEEAIRALVLHGFRTHMGSSEQLSDNIVDIAHSTHFVLVDGAGRLRGYYGSDPAGVDEVFHRAQHVLAESRERR